MTKKYIEKFGQYSGYLDDLLRNRHLEQDFGFGNNDKYSAFCVAKDALQDTNAGIDDILDQERPISVGLAYLQFWGLLQTIYIQQDALTEMWWSLTGIKITEKEPWRGVTDHSDWTKIRNQRNRYCGHPVRSEFKKRVRTSISRNGLSPFSALVTTYFGDGRETEVKFIDLRSGIDRYYRIAVIFIYLIFRKMREDWGPFKWPKEQDFSEAIVLNAPTEFLEPLEVTP